MKTVLRHSLFLLQGGGPLLGDALLLVKMLAIVRYAPLLLPDEFLLALV
ncbi:MAG: hypothetical protein ACRD20_09880 [Terriglobales bacterium]